MLHDIEVHLGRKLFTRTPRGMEPTAEGHLIAHHAEIITDAQDRLAQAFDDLQVGRSGAVRIGAVTGPAIGEVVPAVNWLKSVSPAVDVTLEVGTSVELVRALMQGDLDFVLARVPPGVDDRDLLIEPARAEVVHFLVRQGHPLLGVAPISMDQLHGHLWVLQDRGMPIRRAVEVAFHDAGLTTPPNVVSASSLLVIIALLRGTDAIAPLSQEVVDLLLDPPVSANFCRLPLDWSVTVEPYMILRLRGRALSRAAQMTLEQVRKQLAM